MSGRSAHVRRKITETKGKTSNDIRPPGSRAKSIASSDDNATISEVPLPWRQDTGVAKANARFLKFSEPVRESETLNFRGDIPVYGNHSSDSQSGGSLDGRRDAAATPSQFRGPLEDFAYARARRPNIKTEDVSGIEKSGLRSVVDKKSDNVRKGIAKAFAFRKKDKRADSSQGMLDFRPQSSATVRRIPHGFNNSASDPDLGDREAATTASRPQFPAQAAEHAMLSPPPTAELPPIPPDTASLPSIKRWVGAGRPAQRWNKLRKDPELWDPNGDVLVYLEHRGSQPRPLPSFRLSSHIIEATESRYLIMLLREGSTEEDVHMMPSPVGAPPMLHRHLAAGRFVHAQQHLGTHGGYGRGQPTPTISEDASLDLEDADGQISYEIYLPANPDMRRTDQLRYHVTTRNVFALLYHASLVGISLHQALSDMHARLEAWMPPEADNVATMVNYLGARGIDDVRNNPEAAVSLLAWSEGSYVRWEEGWRESFVHCAGMHASLESCADYKNITPITRALLERASLETQLRVQAAEERLAEFQYTDMWPLAVATIANSSGPVVASEAKGAADRLQKLLVAHYARVYGSWPPQPAQLPGHDAPSDADEMWLGRRVARDLQKDFAALYDYLVDRDIVWDGSEARSSRKWMLVSDSGNRAFQADTPDLPMTDMLVEFDNRLRFPHIPHPYPLVPDSIPPTMGSGKVKPPKKKGEVNASGNGRAGAMERRVQLAYTEATNMLLLGSDLMQSDLIDAFSKLEKLDRVGDVDPLTARRGRWVLIYGILQTLASVSVDAPNVRYRDDVAYHLSPRLKGAKIPPWRGAVPHSAQPPALLGSAEVSHQLSHCWTIPRSWRVVGNSGTESSAASSSGSLAGSPVRGGFRFPRPPTATSTATSTARSSTVGTHSVRSNYPAFSGSESDSGWGVHPPPSSRKVRTREATSKPGRGWAGTLPDGQVWPVRSQSYKQGQTRSPASTSGALLAPDDGLDDWRSGSDLDRRSDRAVSSTASHTGQPQGRSRGREREIDYGRPLLSRDVEESASVVIRDFDELHVIDDDEP